MGQWRDILLGGEGNRIRFGWVCWGRVWVWEEGGTECGWLRGVERGDESCAVVMISCYYNDGKRCGER